MLEKIKRQYSGHFWFVNMLFQSLLIGYLLLLLINQFYPLVYESYLIYLLLVLIPFGMISVFFYEPQDKKEIMNWKDIFFVWTLAVIGVILIFVKTQQLGWLSYVISGVAFGIIVLMGYLIYEKNEIEKEFFDITEKNLKPLLSLVISVVILIYLILGFFIGFHTSFPFVIGGFFLLFVPGLLLSYIFFSFNDRKIDLFERLTLSIALSISIIPLLVFFLHLFGMNITARNVSLVSFLIIVISFIYLIFGKYFKKKIMRG